MDQTKNDSCQKTWSAVPVLGDHGKTRIGFSYIDLYSFLYKLSWLCSNELDATSPASNRFAASNPSKTRPGKIASQQPTKTAGLVEKHGKKENLHRGHRGLKRGRVTNFCRVFFPKPLWIYNFNMRQRWFQGILFTYSWALATWTLFSLALWLATRDSPVFSACCQRPEVWQPATHALYVIKSSDTQVSTAIHSQTLNQQQRDPTPKVTKIIKNTEYMACNPQILSCSTKFPLANLWPSYHPWSSKPVRS